MIDAEKIKTGAYLFQRSNVSYKNA